MTGSLLHQIQHYHVAWPGIAYLDLKQFQTFLVLVA